MNTEISTVLDKTEIEVYNPARAAVLDSVSTLSPMIFTDKRGRDGCFNACVDANKLKTMIEKKRKELTKPYQEKAKQIKSIFDSLIEELENVLALKRKLISTFDAEEKRKAEEAARKLEEERREKERLEREAEENRRREEEAAQRKKEEDERKERERLEAEKKKKLEEANKLSGIALKKEAARIQREAEEKQRKLDEEAAKRKAREEPERIKREAEEKLRKEEEDRKYKEQQEEIQRQASLKGSKKTVIEFKLLDIKLVPEQYTEVVVNWSAVKHAASNGVKEIPGFQAVEKQGTVFAGRA